MAERWTVKVEGFADLERALQEIERKATAKNIAKRALTTAAKPIDADWRRNVRVDTGTLKESGGITTKLSRAQKSQHKRESPVEVFVGPGALVQAVTEEFGTSDQSPHPTLRPAWDAHKNDLPKVIGEEMWVEIDKAAQRAARKAARLAAKG